MSIRIWHFGVRNINILFLGSDLFYWDGTIDSPDKFESLGKEL